MQVIGQLHCQSALPQAKEPPIPIRLEAGWALEPVWFRWRRRSLLALPGFEPRSHPPAPSLVTVLSHKARLISLHMVICAIVLAFPEFERLYVHFRN